MLKMMKSLILLQCVFLIILGCKSIDNTSTLKVENFDQTTTPAAPYYNADTGIWNCGTYSLNDSQVKKRIENAKKLPELYDSSRLHKILLNPCVLTEVVSHRGDVDVAPQNTYPAIEAAVAKKAKFIEIDVFLNSNNEPIVLHDVYYVRPKPFIPAGYNQIAGPTKECFGKNFEVDDWDLMRTCDVSRAYEGHEGITVPLLEKILKDFGNSESIFLIELKKSRNIPVLAKKVTSLLNQYVKDKKKQWVLSFEEDALDSISASVKKVRVVSIARRGDDLKQLIDLGIEKGYDVFALDLSSYSTDIVEYAADRGAGIAAYTLTKTTENQHQQALEVGGSMFITDRLSDFHKLLGK